MSDTERGFRRIFWGLLLVVIDFRLNGFDVLPDFIGFALTAAGLGLIVPLSPRFQTARIMALFLTVLSLTSLIEFTGDAAPQGFDSGWFLFGLVVTALDIVMIWQLCGGIIDVARERDLPDLATRASTRRALYIGLHLMSYLVILVAMDSPGDAGVLIVGTLVFAVIVVCLMMGLMLRAARELSEPPYDPDASFD